MTRARILAGPALLVALLVLHAEPAVSAAPAVRHYLRLGLPIYCGGPERRDVALTFDDGPGRRTPAVLALLRRAHVPATFFLLGRNAVRSAALVRAEAEVGAIGDHSWTHPRLTRLGPGAIALELGETKRALAQLSGRPVFLVRPPYAATNAEVIGVARSLGLIEVLWSIDTRDAEGASAAAIVRTVEHFLKPGSIILMHDNVPATLVALRTVLALLRWRHLTPTTVPVLLARDPPSAHELRGGWPGCYGDAPSER